MKEKYQLPLTKTEAKQLYKYIFIVEGADIKPSKEFWLRHERLATKIQKIVYDSKKVNTSGDTPS